MKVIALVSSAGGLAATAQVLSALPEELPAAVIVLQHTSPDRESLLPLILQRGSRLRVQLAEDGGELLAGHVHVAPAGHQTLIGPGRRFSLIPSGRFPPSRPSADLLLTTLAMAAGDDAVAVVMTGGGHDGATGASVVHKRGGVVLATSMETTDNFSMPAATIGRDHITDAVVPLPDVAARLVELVLAPVLGETPGPERSTTG